MAIENIKPESPSPGGISAREELFQECCSRLKKLISKKEKLLKNIQKDYEKCLLNIQLNKDAEALKNNFHLIKRGLTQVLVMDYYEDPPQERLIELDPKLSPEENVNRIFNLVKRAKRGLLMIEPRIKIIEDELQGLMTQWQQMIEKGPENPELESLSPPPRALRKKGEKRLPYRVFKSGDGTDIWVGRSAKDNDELLKYFTRGNEWWLHAKEIPGSHVVIKSSKDALSLDNLLDGAFLAAHFSKSRGENLEVSYTRVKYVKKIKGMPAGKVSISHAKTLSIKYDQKRIRKLLDVEVKPFD